MGSSFGGAGRRPTSCRHRQGEATKVGAGSSRSLDDGAMNLRRVRTLNRWRVKLKVWRRYLVMSSGSRALAEAPSLATWLRTGVAAGPHAP